MEIQKTKIKVKALRTLNSPYQKGDKSTSHETIYYALVNMKDLPDNLPLDVNPREPKMNTSVAKALKAAVVEPETDFYLNNRGIVISAKDISVDMANSSIYIDLGNQNNDDDKYQYGILDGGHTYMAIIQERDNIPEDITKYVRLEIITNVSNITRLSDARNTSVQVSDIALFNLDNKFDILQEAVKSEPYADKIAYKDNERQEYHVSDFLKLIYAFDIDKYPDDSSAPVQSYSGKAQVFKRYKEAYGEDFMNELVKQLPTLVRLYDTIECEIAEAYAMYKQDQGTAKSRFGAVKGIEPRENGKSYFLKNDIKYLVSAGYLLPIFGAFRSIMQYDSDTNSISWVFDPFEIWEEVKKNLAQNTFETTVSPQLAGKDRQLWLTNYRIVETQSLRKLLKQQKTMGVN